MLDHHLKDPYEVDSVFEAVKQVLKGTNTTTSLAKTVATPPSLIINPGTITATKLPALAKTEVLDAAITTIGSTLT